MPASAIAISFLVIILLLSNTRCSPHGHVGSFVSVAGMPDALLQRSERRIALAGPGFHADSVAEAHELRLRLAVRDDLDRPALRNAARSDFGIIGIGDGARADDRAGDEIARGRRMGDQLVKADLHLAAIGAAEARAGPVDLEVEAPPALAPVSPPFVGGHCKRGHGGARLGEDEAEAALHLWHGMGTQRAVVDLHDQAD